MNDKVKKLLSVRDENDKHIFEAKDVASFHDVSLNAVYNSRKVGDKLDKLMAFAKMQEALAEDEKNTVSLSGDKDGLLNGLEKVLDDRKYVVFYKEI